MDEAPAPTRFGIRAHGKLPITGWATDMSRAAELCTSLESADLHAGSALIRHIPSYPDQASHMRAVRPGTPTAKRARRRCGEPAGNQYDSGAHVNKFKMCFVGDFRHGVRWAALWKIAAGMRCKTAWQIKQRQGCTLRMVGSACARHKGGGRNTSHAYPHPRRQT